MIANVAAGIPESVGKVRRAPRKHRTWIGIREAIRLAGRYKLGPIWDLGEQLFRRRRK